MIKQVHVKKRDISRRISLTDPGAELNTVVYLHAFVQADMFGMKVSVSVSQPSVADSLLKQLPTILKEIPVIVPDNKIIRLAHGPSQIWQCLLKILTQVLLQYREALQGGQCRFGYGMKGRDSPGYLTDLCCRGPAMCEERREEPPAGETSHHNSALHVAA